MLRDTKRQQLEEVLGAFGLRVQREDLLTRCASCLLLLLLLRLRRLLLLLANAASNAAPAIAPAAAVGCRSAPSPSLCLTHTAGLPATPNTPA